MSGIFISHASDDVALVDPFVDNIVRLGCGVPGEQIFYSSGADTGVPSGSDLNAAVRERAAGAGLVVSLLTPAFQTSLFCVAELGAAWREVGALFPLKHPDVDRGALEGVLTGMVVRSFDDEAALDELHDRVCAVVGTKVPARTWSSYKKKWLGILSSLTETQPQPQAVALDATANGANRWGQLFDSFVDAALYTADNTIARTDIESHLRAGTLIPSRYLYAGDVGAANWVRLCGDPMYHHYRETTEFWAGPTGKKIASRIQAELQREDFDYVSLGCGDGEKDADLVSHWLEANADIFYYPYDISLPLVSRAHRAVREQTRRNAKRLMIKAVLADFNYLSTVSQVFKHRRSPNVVALLGNSLGNLHSERQFLRRLAAVMSSEDLLVLEVRLKSEEGKQEPKELASERSMRFDFGPLEHYLGWKFDRKRMTSEHMSNVSSITGTDTTVVSCKSADYGTVKLSYIHEYHEQDFLEALKSLDFEVVTSERGDASEFLVCVARLKPSAA